jgi:peroxiredoxin
MSRDGLQARDESVRVGERAPEFTLKAANAASGNNVGESVSLAELVAQGPVIVEFLRGTW